MCVCILLKKIEQVGVEIKTKHNVVLFTDFQCGFFFSENPPHLKIHSYRAALQYVVTETRPDFQHGATRLVVKKGAEIPFPQ